MPTKIIKLENYDRIIRKNLPGVIITLVLMISGQWAPDVSASILDSADIVVAEVEPNVPGEVQNLNEHFALTKAVGVEGSLSDPNDEDAYRFSIGPEWSMELLFEIQAAEDKTITAVAVGVDSQVYFVSENSIWRRPLEEPNAEFVISSRAITQQLELDPEIQIQVSAIAGVPSLEAQEILVIILGGNESVEGGTILALDPNDELTVIATRNDITALTGELHVDIAAAAADEEGRIYIADQVSGSVLQIEREPGVEPAAYLVSIYTDAYVLQEAIEIEVFKDLLREITTTPRTVIAQVTGTFIVNSLVQGRGDYAVPGFDTYYLSQLGPDFDGSGGITRITVDQFDANDVVFDEFFTPELNDLNPSALALDTSAEATFGQQLFMGTFGPSLGDDFDGQVFVVNNDGDITPFVTSFEDGQGQTAIKGDEEVTGFFDVVDMAFPLTMDDQFGSYLYVLSENIDQNGAEEEGGFSSDLWRINPDGVAELFVESIADGVISLAFGNFAYGNDLFVATFNSGGNAGKVLRVDSGGNVETFFDFSPFGSSISVSDLAFAPVDLPVDSPMAGALVLTVKSGSAGTAFAQLEPDGVTVEFWATDLDTGDVSSGDLIFDESGNLIIAQQIPKNLIQLEYLGLFDYTFDQLQVRPMLEESLEEISFVPYALIDVADQPRILRLSDSPDPTDIVTEAGPSVLDVGEVPEDGRKEISFVFDAVGDLFTYIQNVDELQTSRRNQDGKFTQFTTQLTGTGIDAFTSLVDAHLPQLAVSADGSLLAIGTNGDEAQTGQEPPSQEFDDVVISLGNTIDGVFEPDVLVRISDLTQMHLELTGPGEFHEFITDAGSVLEETLEELNEGSYILSVSSVQNSSGSYEMLIILDNTIPGELICDESTGPIELTNQDGESLILTHRGPGQTELKFKQDPNGLVVELTSLTITGSNSSTSVTLTNQQDPDDMVLGELVLNGSLDRLEYKGTLDMLRGAEFTKGTVKQVDLGTVRDVNAEKYTFPVFRATNLGDPETESHQFLARKLTSLIVENNVQNINVLEFGSRNAYRLIDIGGIVDFGEFFGLNISKCIVRNTQNEAKAMNESFLYFTPKGGSIGAVRIEQGDLYRTGIFANKSIGIVELLNGNLDTSAVETAGQKSGVDTVIVRRVDALTDPNESGNIVDSRIAAGRGVNRVHADENIGDGTTISTSNNLRGTIHTVTCQGDCSAGFSSLRIKEILVGFDRNKRKMPESDEFTGGNFSGSVSVLFSLDLLSATGSIENAFIGANRFFGFGTIKSIFAEDGLTNTTIRFNRKTTRIMVGYENGKRNRIVNNDADVSGDFSGPRLGRLYYTGENTADLSVNRVGPVIDDVP